MVDFNDPRLQFLIEKDVESKNLEAHGVLDVIRLTTSVGVCKLWLHRQQTFDNSFLDVTHNLL